MTETRRTSFFALLFFIYFIGVSFLMAYLPLASRLSDSAYMLLSQLICFVPPLLVYFKWIEKKCEGNSAAKPFGVEKSAASALLRHFHSTTDEFAFLSDGTLLPQPCGAIRRRHPVLRLSGFICGGCGFACGV